VEIRNQQFYAKQEVEMLSRWDPFREMLTMRRAMDRLMENSVDQGEWSKTEWALALDVLEHEDEFMVKASLPGVKPEDLDITFDKGLLTIRGEIKDDSEKEVGQYHLRERRFGTFVRTIALPTGVKAEDIQAEYSDGVLNLRLPKAEEGKPRRIAINSGQKSEQKVINHRN
jgi:HSP20 family protein